MTDFNWRDYIRLEDTAYFYGPDGNVLPDYQDRLPKIRDTEAQLALIARTLDEISTIPEVQRIIMDTKSRSDTAGELLTIGLSSRTEYDSGSHFIGINSMKIFEDVYQSAKGPQDYSLQHVLIHELQHPATKDMDERTNRYGRGAIAQVVQEFLADNPEYQSEYDSKGTLAGHDIKSLLKLNTYEAIMDTLDKEYSASIKVTNRESLNTRYKEMLTPKEFVGTYLFSRFEPVVREHIIREEETAVIARTNEIMTRHYGEEPRIGYNNPTPPKRWPSRRDYYDDAELQADNLAARINPQKPQLDVIRDTLKSCGVGQPCDDDGPEARPSVPQGLPPPLKEHGPQ